MSPQKHNQVKTGQIQVVFKGRDRKSSSSQGWKRIQSLFMGKVKIQGLFIFVQTLSIMLRDAASIILFAFGKAQPRINLPAYALPSSHRSGTHKQTNVFKATFAILLLPVISSRSNLSYGRPYRWIDFTAGWLANLDAWIVKNIYIIILSFG